MATVRLTKDLTKLITEEAKLMFDARVVAADTPPKEFNTQDIYDLWLDNEPGLRADIAVGIRRGWLVAVTSFKVKMLNNKTVDVLCSESKHSVHVPYAIANHYGAGLRINGVGTVHLYEIAHEWEISRKALLDSRDQFNGQVANLLQKHETLKQALSEWPALWDLVPQKFKTLHNEEKLKAAEAKKAKAFKPQVNLDVLNGAVVTHKILKGGFNR